MIQGMFDGGAMPVLERVAQFAEARHGVLTHNIANLSTPFFKATDLDPDRFQASLREAIDHRRSNSNNPTRGPVTPADTDQVRFESDGITTHPATQNDNLLFHDQNNRDLERVMARLAENTMNFNMSMDLLKNQFNMLETAIRERV